MAALIRSTSNSPEPVFLALNSNIVFRVILIERCGPLLGRAARNPSQTFNSPVGVDKDVARGSRKENTRSLPRRCHISHPQLSNSSERLLGEISPMLASEQESLGPAWRNRGCWNLKRTPNPSKSKTVSQEGLGDRTLASGSVRSVNCESRCVLIPQKGHAG